MQCAKKRRGGRDKNNRQIHTVKLMQHTNKHEAEKGRQVKPCPFDADKQDQKKEV